MADYNTLYEQMKDSADDMSQASVEMRQMMTADENTDVNIEGYGLKPSFSKQIGKPIVDIEERFQQFLLSSGYHYLGEYDNGPWRFTERNQYISRNGQNYRLSDNTALGWSTTGTTQSSFNADLSHLVLMKEDQVLRQDLGSSDGYKYIGQCPDIPTLRTIEPTSTGQKIQVMSYRSGWAAEAGAPVGGGEFYYDKNDTTSADDDIFVFVTPKGARWKRGSSGKKIKLEWKGIRSGDDATAALTSIGAYLKARAKAAGTIARLPRCEIDAGDYYLSDTVTLTGAFRIKSTGFVAFRTSSTWDMTLTKPIINIENDADIPIQPKEKVWGTMDPYINGLDGTIAIYGPGVSPFNKCRGLSVGNPVSGRTAVRGACAWGFAIHNCGDGLHLRMNVTYLLTFKDFNIGDNNCNLTVPTQVAADAGERISFTHGGFGAASGPCIYLALSPSLFFDHVSFDFNAADIFLLEGTAQYGVISLTNCHWEVMGGYLMRATTGSRLRFFITNCNFIPTQFGVKTPENSQSPSRPMIHMEQGGNVNINGLSLMEGYRPLTHENFLVTVGSEAALKKTKVSVKGMTAGDLTYTPCPVKSAVMNPSWDMSDETAGATITNRTTYATKNLIPAQEEGLRGWSLGMSASVVALSDGTKALKITSTDQGYAYLQNKTRVPVTPGAMYSSYFSIQKLIATGDINWGLGYYWYDSANTLIKYESVLSDNFSSVYNNTTLPGYVSDATENGNRKISTLFGAVTAPPGAAYCVPVFNITGWLGDINVINHIFWELK